MIHTAVFAFNLPHYITSYMHHTCKKRKKKEKKIGYDIFASRGFEPRPSESGRRTR